MPNLWAHIQFGREILNGLPWRHLIQNPAWRTAFQLGCQGPDFLFYDHFLPWQSATAVNQLGTLLHNWQCGPFLLDLFDAVRETGTGEHADPAGTVQAFALGFLLHHVLDRHLHPYIFSRSGFKKWHHQRFETAMDAVILQQRAGISTGKTPAAPEIDTGGKLPGQLAAVFVELAGRHYPGLAPQLTPDRLDAAAAQFVSAQKLFFDPQGWKRWLLFGQIAPFSPPRVAPAWDVLNASRHPWIDPTDRTLIHTDSAMDLWSRALEDGATAALAGIAWLESAGASPEEATPLQDAFIERVGNVSYETGLPCGTASIIYAEPVI